MNSGVSQKTNVKASFVIGNERIVCKRTIAEKFNNYFVSLASNLQENKKFQENKNFFYFAQSQKIFQIII